GQGRGDAFGRNRERLYCRAAFARVQVACGPRVERPRPAGLELPLSLAVDLDCLVLVTLRVERTQHRTRRCHRDLVLAQAAAAEDRDSHALAHGTAVVVPV